MSRRRVELFGAMRNKAMRNQSHHAPLVLSFPTRNLEALPHDTIKTNRSVRLISQTAEIVIGDLVELESPGAASGPGRQGASTSKSHGERR